MIFCTPLVFTGFSLFSRYQVFPRKSEKISKFSKIISKNPKMVTFSQNVTDKPDTPKTVVFDTKNSDFRQKVQ